MTKQRCPICGAPAAQEIKPFCSARCRDVDLHRWLSGQYAIPTNEPVEEEELRRANAADRPDEDD